MTPRTATTLTTLALLVGLAILPVQGQTPKRGGS